MEQAPSTDAGAVPGFAEFVERTVNFKLHDWQRFHLCPLLERLRHEKGLRIAVHGPPQFGKSVLVSQRAPAYLIGCDPKTRVGLACYNETHSTGFGQVVKDLLLQPDFAEMFPDPGLVVSKDAPAARFSTAARAACRDAQPSFLAMGLLSGFTGKGVDHLFIDDPYKSAEEARSATINEKVWRWWSQTAEVRLGEQANVVVMFHRYHEDDFAGRLLASGGWEYVRFPAVADANPDGSDPTGRLPGEPLSPMRSREWLDKKAADDALTWAGQFQGTPLPESGNFFNVTRLLEHRVSAADVPRLRSVCRAWDLAATAGAGDWTVGAKLGIDAEGRYYILDVVRGRWATDERNAVMRNTAALDGKTVRIRVPQDPGQAGVDQAQAMVRMLAGYAVKAERVSGDKVTRADPFSAQVNAGNVSLVEADWNAEYLRVLRNFPFSTAADDDVDASADAFNELATTPSRPVFGTLRR